DVLALIVAGLRGGGWQGSAADLRTVEIAGGPVEAARVAAMLLARAFAV
ncbi:MAG: GTA-gp10 family protein, partial [Paracoccaceae bacterium]